jgi:rhodanese-related sulfurtransferase
MSNEVKKISYDEFLEIRKSGKPYTLLDVLSSESYDMGHIEVAKSFPVDEINQDTAEKRLPEEEQIIVYCGSFACQASTEAAKKLSDMGYDVLEYDGGLKEWQEKGNKLVSNR